MIDTEELYKMIDDFCQSRTCSKCPMQRDSNRYACDRSKWTIFPEYIDIAAEIVMSAGYKLKSFEDVNSITEDELLNCFGGE